MKEEKSFFRFHRIVVFAGVTAGSLSKKNGNVS